jgi:nucleotide-binding universal stress UspA family protein
MTFTNDTRRFDRARFRADLEQIWARLTGHSIDLLAFEEVRRRLHAELTANRTLQEIPIAAIVGSVGRPGDFTRDFLPLNDRDAHRWSQVRQRFNEPSGVPPIEVYQVGEAYFVLDGNHRVSVAREMGAAHIEAYVTEVRSRVPLTPEADPREVILKARYLEFLERTQLDRLRPEADLQVTHLGRYAELERHISLHRYVLETQQRRAVPLAEAVEDWYDRVYLPVVRAIREQGTLDDYPGRTEADLYLLVSGYRLLVEEFLNWEFEAETLPVSEPNASLALPQFLQHMLSRLRPGVLHEDQVRPGDWRREHAGSLEPGFRMFTSVLVPVSGGPGGWQALAQASVIAHREQGRVLGLHVVADDTARSGPPALEVKAEFERRCQAAGVVGRLAIEAGEVAQRICERSAWVDLTVVRLAYPPPAEPWAKLSSGFRALVRRCASPLLVLPEGSVPESGTTQFGRALLAFNASPQALRALRVASYLAQHWCLDLAVLSVDTGGFDAAATLAQGREHLQAAGVTASYHLETGPVADVVLSQVAAHACDLVITGSYGRGPFLEIALGSTVDHLLRRSRVPTLICP